MDQAEKELIEQITGKPAAAFEMANVSREDTGLPYDLWIDSMGKDRQVQHNDPRIKVHVDGKMIPITISENPDIPESVKKRGIKDFPHSAEVKKYVKAYFPVLMAHYNKMISDKEALIILSTMEEADSPAFQELLAKKGKKNN